MVNDLSGIRSGILGDIATQIPLQASVYGQGYGQNPFLGQNAFIGGNNPYFGTGTQFQGHNPYFGANTQFQGNNPYAFNTQIPCNFGTCAPGYGVWMNTVPQNLMPQFLGQNAFTNPFVPVYNLPFRTRSTPASVSRTSRPTRSTRPGASTRTRWAAARSSAFRAGSGHRSRAARFFPPRRRARGRPRAVAEPPVRSRA